MTEKKEEINGKESIFSKKTMTEEEAANFTFSDELKEKTAERFKDAMAELGENIVGSVSYVFSEEELICVGEGKITATQGISMILNILDIIGVSPDEFYSFLTYAGVKGSGPEGGNLADCFTPAFGSESVH